MKIRLSEKVKYACYDMKGDQRLLVRQTDKPSIWKLVMETEEGDEEHYVTTEVKDSVIEDLSKNIKGFHASGYKPYEEEMLEEVEKEVEI